MADPSRSYGLRQVTDVSDPVMTLHSAISPLLLWLAFPPGVLVVGLACGSIAAVLGRWRLAFAFLAAPVAATLVLAVPWIADQVIDPLERRAVAASRSALAAGPLPRTAVVLGGVIGSATHGDESGYDLSGAADRVVKGAHLWQTGQVDRLVLAGGSDGPTSEAELMARFAGDLGVPRAAMLLEGESRTTRENARFVAALLRKGGIGPDVALVTSAVHLPRAMAEFRCVGLAPVAVPAEFEGSVEAPAFPGALIPSLGTIDKSRRGLKEWVGRWVGGC